MSLLQRIIICEFSNQFQLLFLLLKAEWEHVFSGLKKNS